MDEERGSWKERESNIIQQVDFNDFQRASFARNAGNYGCLKYLLGRVRYNINTICILTLEIESDR